MRLAEIANPRIHTLYRFWDRHRLPDGRPMPRSAVDPTELAPLLANVMLLQVVDPGREDEQPPELRFRLAGDEIERRYGRSLRGAALQEIFPLVHRGDTSQQWADILRDKKPKYRRGPMIFPDQRRFEAERVIFPLSAGKKDVGYILGAIFYLPLRSAVDSLATEAGDLDP